MTITFDPSLLLAYYQAKTGVPLTGSAATSGATTAAAPTVPTAPWKASASTSTPSGKAAASAAASAQAATQAATVRSVLAGGSVLNPSAAKLDAPLVADAQDYKSLFTLYQGLTTLQTLAAQASATGVSTAQQAQLASAFTRGLGQVQAYLDAAPFKRFEVAQAAVEAKATSGAGVPLETDTYTTANIHSGDLNAAVPAFQGDVRFTLTATDAKGAAKSVAFDLADLGSTPRTLPNVVDYLNGKLAAAGLVTRFTDVLTPGTPQTTTAGGKTITLGPGSDQYALKIVGSPTEALSFSAPSSDPAVFLTGVETQPGAATVAGTPGPATATAQLIKLDAAPGADPNAPPESRQALGAAVAAARATASAPDGSLYAIQDVTTASGRQTLQGARDVQLVKYDSAGNVVFTRELGAASSASGYALSVSADGSKVAVAGSVTGALDPARPPTDATTPDSFVSVFDALGEPSWTQRLTGAAGPSRATGVAVGDDGSAFVTGTTQAALPGQAQAGVQDGYLQGFSAAGTGTFTAQFGGSGVNAPAGVTVDGSSVVVAGVENGHAVVRSWDLSASGPPTAGTVRDLGDLQGGGVAGVATLADGSVVVAGSTHNGALDAGTVTQAADGGQDAFVAKLSGGLQPASTDTVAYVGGGADRTVSGLTVSGGQVYLTGELATTPPAGQAAAANAYALALDSATGQVGWSGSVSGQGGTEAPTGVAVVQGGASVLDRLGLPTSISYAKSALLTADAGLRPGDEFFVRTGGGAARAVTIDATDTLQSLADKINRASGFNLTATVVPSGGVDRLQITPANDQKVEIESGPSGRNALGPLGLLEGVVEKTQTVSKPVIGAPTANGKTYALGFPASLDISTAAGAKAAATSLSNAISRLKAIYTDLTTPVAAASTGTSGKVPAYLTAQIADYQAAVNRLSGGG